MVSDPPIYERPTPESGADRLPGLLRDAQHVAADHLLHVALRVPALEQSFRHLRQALGRHDAHVAAIVVIGRPPVRPVETWRVIVGFAIEDVVETDPDVIDPDAIDD